jgi:hypothetical protein
VSDAARLRVVQNFKGFLGDSERSEIGTLFESQVQPLEAMLQKMGGDTKPKPSDKA